MKIKIFYTKYNPQNKTAILNRWLSFIPLWLQEINLEYKNEDDRVRNLLGKLLLTEGIKSLGYSKDLIEDIKFNQFSKPYLSNNFDFSISHSGSYVFCAIGENLKLGVDIEEIQSINFQEMKEIMTDCEWKQIKDSLNPLKSFFKFWTLKEAVIKAKGKGFFAELQQITIEKNTIQIENSIWFYRELIFDENYSGHIVVSEFHTEIEMICTVFI